MLKGIISAMAGLIIQYQHVYVQKGETKISQIAGFCVLNLDSE